jgi:membrane protease YdiL (CAAX protease family)
MTVDRRADADKNGTRHLLEAVLGGVGFCALSYLTQPLPATLPLVITGLATGLIYGYSFQRTGRIVAPWLAHALSGIM